MRSTRAADLVVAILGSLAMAVFVNAHAAFAQDAPASTGSDTAGADANWEPLGPALDDDVETADKVLEIPSVTCAKGDTSEKCDSANANSNDDDDDGEAINAPSPGAPPPDFDDDTASNAAPNQDWGSVDDYQNQEVYAVPYAIYPYPMGAVATANRASPLPSSAYVPMSSPLTQAARPPLNPGPWVTPPRMSTFSRPAGSPLMGMTMSHGAFGFHH